MDTPRPVVSLLESFPPDIWAYLAIYLPGEQLGRLMITGATFLWQRLTSQKVVKSISLGSDFVAFKSFPTFLNRFPALEELLIYSHSDAWSTELGLTIDLIPSGVRKVELSGSWDDCADGLFGETLKLHEHLPHLEIFSVDSLEFSSYSWMTHSPQSLTRLSVNTWESTVELPSSLLYFRASCVNFSTDSVVSKLPPSLENFLVGDAPIGKLISLVIPLLPPSTFQLFIGEPHGYLAGPRSAFDLFERLPKFLTSFQLPDCLDFNFGTNLEAMTLFPSTLTELDMGPPLSDSAWSLLPRNLTALSFQAPKSVWTVYSEIVDNHGAVGHYQVGSFHFETLPRSITSLRLRVRPIRSQYFCGPPATSDQPFFPPQLTSLTIPNIQLSPKTVQLLPSSLTYLETGNFCERVCEHLPNNLKTLKSSQALMSPNLIKFLPRSLTSLQLSICHDSGHWFDYNTGEKVGSLTNPAYSIHSRCLLSSFEWKETFLPPNLTHFDLHRAYELGDSFLLHQKLPNLLELMLSFSKHFTDLSIPLLSPHLTTLDLECSSKISGKSFCLLPRCLTDLNLDSSESIFDSDVQHLPRTLKQVSLSNAIHLTDFCVSDLPPHLEWLDMRRNEKITPSSLPLLPYRLRSTQLYQPVTFANWSIQRGVIQQQ